MLVPSPDVIEDIPQPVRAKVATRAAAPPSLLLLASLVMTAKVLMTDCVIPFRSA
jgi:hypothetical protein